MSKHFPSNLAAHLPVTRNEPIYLERILSNCCSCETSVLRILLRNFLEIRPRELALLHFDLRLILKTLAHYIHLCQLLSQQHLID